jgi:hypothetical protein
MQSSPFEASYRLGYLGQVYYHYANIVLRLQWMASGDTTQRTNEKVAIDHAGELRVRNVHLAVS